MTRSPGVETRHGFSFGRHYDPAHVAHGRLVLHDEHRLEPGAGFDPHPHRDVEVVSWVLEGTLLHEHDGHRAEVVAGGLQRMTAGTGVVHAERAGPEGARFLQLWLAAEPGAAPAYEQVPSAALAEVLPGVHAGRLDADWTLPDAPRAHLHVADGHCRVGDVALRDGDSLLLSCAGPQVVAGRARVLVVLLEE